MKVQVVGKDFKITEAINEYFERKLERIEKYFEEASAEMVVRAEKNEQIAEVVVIANGKKYRAEAEEKDLYASIDKVMDILEGQIRKEKTKKEKMIREGSIKDLDVISENEKELRNEKNLAANNIDIPGFMHSRKLNRWAGEDASGD